MRFGDLRKEEKTLFFFGFFGSAIYGFVLFVIVNFILFGGWEEWVLSRYFAPGIRPEPYLVCMLLSPLLYGFARRIWSRNEFEYGSSIGIDLSYGGVAAWVLFHWVSNPDLATAEPLFVSIAVFFACHEYFFREKVDRRD